MKEYVRLVLKLDPIHNCSDIAQEGFLILTDCNYKKIMFQPYRCSLDFWPVFQHIAMLSNFPKYFNIYYLLYSTCSKEIIIESAHIGNAGRTSTIISNQYEYRKLHISQTYNNGKYVQNQNSTSWHLNG